MDRAEAVRRLVPVFRHYGYEGTTLARISAATELGRASLYHHFPNGKKEMAEAVLQYAGEWFGSNVLEPLQRDGDPVQRLQVMCNNLTQFYSHGQEACLIALFTVGESDELFHQQIQGALKAWIGAIAQVLQDAGLPSEIAYQRGEDAVMRIQGALVLTRGLNDTAPFERVVGQLSTALLANNAQ